MGERTQGQVNQKPKLSLVSKNNSAGKTRKASVTKGSSVRKNRVPARKRKTAQKKLSIPSHLRSVKKRKGEIITYVLDSNIIMHEPNAIFTFGEHDVVICSKVWEEIDSNKGGHSQENFNVRKTVRYLSDLVKQSKPDDLKDGLTLHLPPELENGKSHKGKIFWDFSKLDLEKISKENFYLNPAVSDHHILATCMKLKSEGKNVVLISNDQIFRVFASHAGIVAEEHFSGVIEALPATDEDVITGFHHLPDGLWSNLENAVVNLKGGKNDYHVEHDFFKFVDRNDFLIIPENNLKLRVIAKSSSKEVRAVQINKYSKSEIFGVEAKNLGQELAMELLMDQDLPAVSLAGGAGSGKTFLALASAIAQRLSGVYNRIIVTRSPHGSDEDLGFLPGSESEKMSPWMGGIYDNLEELATGGDFSAGQNAMTLEYVMQANNISVMSLNFMKGRSFQKTCLIVDEAQDLTPKTLKMIATRMGEGSKIIFLGNVDQIDNNYVSEHTNGLSVFIRKSASSSLVGHVTLQAGERSKFATWAEKKL